MFSDAAQLFTLPYFEDSGSFNTHLRRMGKPKTISHISTGPS
jgi:hypothetical protein